MWRYLGISVILILTAMVYGPVLQSEYVAYDDELLIVDNVKARGVTWENVKAAFTTYDPELYIPLMLLTEQIEYSIVGTWNPAVSHGIILGLHIMNAVLVFALVTLLLGRFQRADPRFQKKSNSQFVAIAIATLWAVHPLNVEAVAWAAARKDLLSGFFFLLTIILYLRSQKSKERPYFLLLTSYFSFLLGLLAKVSIAPLPLVLLLLEWFLSPQHPLPFKGEGRVRVLRRILPYFLLSIVFGVIALLGKTRNVANTSLLESLLLGAKSAIFYLQKLLLPSHLSVLYPYTDPVSFGNLDLLIPFLLVIGLFTLAWIARRHFPMLTFALAWYVLLLLPSFTTFRKGDDVELDLYFASDRYAYLPNIGIVLFIAALVTSLCTHTRTHREEQFRRKIVTGLIGIIVSSLGFLSIRQAQTWRTTETLFQNVIRSYPNAHIAQNNLGLFEQGRGNSANAIDHYRKAIAIRPTGRTYYNLGLTYIAQGEREKAMEANRTALTINPRHARAHLNLGGLLLENGKITEALRELNTAISIDPELALAHFDLGLAYERLGKLPMAEEAYTRALEKDPNDIETLVSLAALLVHNRQLDDALILLKRAISLQPHHPRYESLLLEIARLQGKKIPL
ncbi:tetratricopeptide repeat protein [Candidatus Peregrinibacteria bacterium]|nr:tetratricopeptide repeat protein [Candidatus Peregrinibacteria bacterium]